ncbi:MAG: insulinase family protein [Ignavibacteriales bacterium]|nr:insulinase family protein [Ignavibacteriales bacterium]
MKQKIIQVSVLLLLSFLFGSLSFTDLKAQEANQKILPLELTDKIPLDGTITIGKLDNGLTYYIQKNKKPEKRAELRLAVKVGSVVEDDDQQGLAHFSEHMAFNGTKNFKKQALIDYLESIGMKFGPEVNAYTSFDQTVYMIQVPTDSIHVMQKAFQILEDWAHNVSYENEEIDKERGVIIEEWRLGRGASERMFKKQLPVLFKDSKYAERYVIGKKEILESFDYGTIKRFYKDWYRPELMAVVAVGDFDKSKIEALIKEHFSKLVDPKDPRERINFPIPAQKGTLFAIAADKEAPMSSVTIYSKSKAEPDIYVKDFRTSTVEGLFSGMLSQRLNELTQKPDAPFAYAGAGKGRFLGDQNVFNLIGYAVKDNKMGQCLDVLLTEYERAKRFGFTQSELERTKESRLRSSEKWFLEKDKADSREYAEEYLRNFLQDEIIPGREYEYLFYKKYLPTITLAEVNAIAPSLMTGDNRVITINMPEKEGLQIPTEQDLKAVIDAVPMKEITAYEDKVSNQPLVEKEPKASPVVDEKYLKEIDVTEWTLANGAKVVLKPTDFKNDEIMFMAASPGGSSLVHNADYVSASQAGNIIRQSGAGSFNYIQLQKYLTGKIVSVFPFVGDLSEGINGTCSPKDLETAFQLIYLNFTSPRKDSAGYLAYKAQMQNYLANQKASPEKAFQDTIQVTLNDYNIRRRPMNSELLNEIDFDKAYQIYKDRFADASDFTFYFVGKFDKEKIKPLIEKYIGSLPSIKRNETWKDIGINYPQGVVEKNVYKGIEPKSFVQLIFTGPFNWTPQNRWEYESMRNVLDIKLREVIREEKGGTYGVAVYGSPEKNPKERYTFNIWFGCNPERVDELTKTVFVQLDSLKNYNIGDLYLTKVKEIQKRTNETNLKENRYWLSSLYSSYWYNEDPLLILEKDKLTETLDKSIIQKRAKETFGDNYIKVVLYPEKK